MTGDLIASIDRRIEAAKEQRRKLEAAREALTGRKRRGRPSPTPPSREPLKPNTRRSPGRSRRPRVAMPELDQGLRTRGAR